LAAPVTAVAEDVAAAHVGRTLKVRAAKHFLNDYRKASGPLQHAMQREVHDMKRRAKASTNWASEYRHAKGYRAKVIELRLAGGPRALAHVNGYSVTLLSMGDHEVTDRARRINIHDAVATKMKLPAEFNRKSRFFPADSTVRGLTAFGNESQPEWLYFLDESQTATYQDILTSIENALLDESQPSQIHLVVGGPGTGKTSVLLQLLNGLSNIGGSKESWRVGIQLSDHVAQYITAATRWNLRRCRALGRALADADVLLIDDPASSADINAAIRSARLSPTLRAVVIAFDALQLGDSLRDADFDRLASTGRTVHHLGACYRQKEAVGRCAMEAAKVIAESSPFLVETKQRRYAEERRRLTELCNGVVFSNPSGYTRTFETSTREDWATHASWICGRPDLWAHWPSTLLVIDPATQLPKGWRSDLSGVRPRVVSLDDTETIKGLEFQHAVIVLSRDQYRSLCDGFTGSGRHLYDDYRLLRIPFTRAKDSLAIFVLD
jgi:hypothetical protein